MRFTRTWPGNSVDAFSWRPLNKASKLATHLTLARNDCPVADAVEAAAARTRMRALLAKALNEGPLDGCASADQRLR